MLLAYTRDDDKRQIVAVVTGPGTIHEIHGVIDRQLADKAWTYGLLYDFRGSLSIPTADEYRRLVDYIRSAIEVHGPRGPVAIVVKAGPQFVLARMYSFLSEDRDNLRVEVFTDKRKADRWLGRHALKPA